MGFGSLEAALTTTADVATDCISWWTWTRQCRGCRVLMADFLERLYKTQNKAAEMSVRGVLTAMSVKIPITKL
jgi:hypothetical protein